MLRLFLFFFFFLKMVYLLEQEWHAFSEKGPDSKKILGFAISFRPQQAGFELQSVVC